MKTTTTALEAIKARAEKATEGPWKDDGDGGLYMHGVGAQFMGGVEAIRNAHFAAHSRTDVPKLVAALEAVQARLSEQASQFRETADRLIQHVLDLDPDRDVEGASRYSHYAASWDAAQRMTERTIAEALQ